MLPAAGNHAWVHPRVRDPNPSSREVPPSTAPGSVPPRLSAHHPVPAGVGEHHSVPVPSPSPDTGPGASCPHDPRTGAETQWAGSAAAAQSPVLFPTRIKVDARCVTSWVLGGFPALPALGHRPSADAHPCLLPLIKGTSTEPHQPYLAPPLCRALIAAPTSKGGGGAPGQVSASSWDRRGVGGRGICEAGQITAS